MTPWTCAFVKALAEPSHGMAPTEPNEFLQHPPKFAQPHLWDYWKLQLSWKAKLYQGAHLRGGMPITDPAPSVSTAPGKLWLVLPGNLSWGPALPPCVKGLPQPWFLPQHQ